jgi:arylsulfatase A-like enzyme
MKVKPDLNRTRCAGVGRRMGWIAALLVLATSGCNFGSDSGNEPQPPNIIFFILDDVGIDQMSAFGYGGAVGTPQTPVIDTLVKGGVMFRNTWAMAECSPSRAMFFNGRYPIRTGIANAITPSDLANSQMSPYESTTPAILKGAGYASGIFGKTHLTGSARNPSNNPYGATAQFQLGWDQFSGWGEGAPESIDTTAGGVATTGISLSLIHISEPTRLM